jgi:hypothetical protein
MRVLQKRREMYNEIGAMSPQNPFAGLLIGVHTHRTAGHFVCAFLELVLNYGSFPSRIIETMKTSKMVTPKGFIPTTFRERQLKCQVRPNKAGTPANPMGRASRAAGHCVCAFLYLVLKDGKFPFREFVFPSPRECTPLYSLLSTISING